MPSFEGISLLLKASPNSLRISFVVLDSSRPVVNIFFVEKETLVPGVIEC